MTRGEINFQIFCFLSLLLIGKSLSQSEGLDQILESLKNVEELLKESSQPSTYLATPIGLDEIPNPAERRHSRDLDFNVESPDNGDTREHLKRHPASSRNPNWGNSRSSIDANPNSDGNINQFQPGNGDDFESDKPIPRRPLKFKKKPRTTDNSNNNVNNNVNSNFNTVEKNPVAVDSRPKSPGSNSGILSSIGDRRLSNPSRDVIHKTNVDSNTNINANSMYSVDYGDNEMDEER